MVKVDRAAPLLLARGSTGSIPLLTLWRMAMGTRDPEQPPLWIATSDLPVSPGHPFYTRLNALLDADGFDAFVEEACRTFYAPVLGRPSLAPGRYFRLLLVGYFEGIDSERGIAWRAADSLAVRSFLRLRAGGGGPGSLDDFAHPPRDRCGDAPGGVPVGVHLEFPILSLHPRLRQRCVAPDVWPTLSRA